MIDIAPWLELALRWLHVMAGISWIGTSFYFIWLDNHLRQSADSKPGVAGELWAVHGGGFYHKQKYLVAPAELPAELHWFKWEAYFTWISGFLLLAVMYYWGASFFLVDADKLALTPLQAVLIGLAFLIGGWLVYEALCRLLASRDPLIFGIVWFLLLTATAYVLTSIFNDRGAFIHVGAIVGTAMAANVFVIIIPNQKKVVADMIAGKTPDPALGRQAKQRSLHNNYMTLPVLLIMISNHYPMLFASEYNWLILAGLSLAGVLIRHVFNLRAKGKVSFDFLYWGVALFLVTIFMAADLQSRSQAIADQVPPVSFAQVRPIIDRHCMSCHSAKPTHDGVSRPPAGLIFERPHIIAQNATRILRQAVTSESMPLGNETQMSAEERRILGAWIQQGAKTTGGGP
jgi:uncharacterized membrane protein